MRKAAENATLAATPSARIMAIYTRFGDKGKTALYSGKTVSKGSLRIDAYGSVDELNSSIGVALNLIKDAKIKKELILVQNDLFEVGSHLSGFIKSAKAKGYYQKRVNEFEKTIDLLTRKLPKLSHFILPGGGKAGAYLQVVRTVARRAERRVAELSEKEKLDKEVLIYMNRLSDLLFTFARYINYKEKKKEIIWTSK